jgi:hypothetical protein
MHRKQADQRRRLRAIQGDFIAVSDQHPTLEACGIAPPGLETDAICAAREGAEKYSLRRCQWLIDLANLDHASTVR